MPDTIRDGQGRGYQMGVNSDHRALVDAQTQPFEFNIAVIEENTFAVTTEQWLTLNSTNAHAVLYIRNDDSERNMHISTVTYSYNGGDTNHNRTMLKECIRNPNAPTANYTEQSQKNLNFGSTNEGSCTLYVWDGVGDGMTMSGGTSILTSIVPAGTLIYDKVDSIVVGYQNSFAWRFTGEEVGKMAISLRYYFKKE